MTRWCTPECQHDGPGACRRQNCRYFEARAHERCTLSHVAAHGPRTLTATADVLGMSDQGVRAVEQRAVRKLDAALGSSGLRAELEAALRAAESRPVEPRTMPEPPGDATDISTELSKRAKGSPARGLRDLLRRRRRRDVIP